MSFDIFLQRFRNGDKATFPRALFEEIFGRRAIAPTYPLTRVDYPDGSGADIYGGGDDDIEGLMFNHGGGGLLFDAIYELAQRTQSVVHWPDTAPSVAVADAATISHFPDGFDCLGPPQIVADGQALMDYISRPT